MVLSLRRPLIVPVGGVLPTIRLGTSATFTPVAGYDFWLKADAIVGLNDGDAVATWKDSGVNNRDATQSTPSKQPTYKTGIIGGLPVVRFDGSSDWLDITKPTATYNAWTLFLVIRPTGANPIGIIDTGASVSYTFRNYGAGNMEWWQNSPDNVVWFDQLYVAGMSASKKITSELSYFGPYLRLSYATTGASVTGTVWVAVKE